MKSRARGRKHIHSRKNKEHVVMSNAIKQITDNSGDFIKSTIAVSKNLHENPLLQSLTVKESDKKNDELSAFTSKNTYEEKQMAQMPDETKLDVSADFSFDISELRRLRGEITLVVNLYRQGKISIFDARSQVAAFTSMMRAMKMELDLKRMQIEIEMKAQK